jgi:hypothetical protein
MTNFTDGEPARFYERRLPSGGFVAIQVSPVRTLFGPAMMRAEIVVERRPESRRQGHRAPIAACAERAKAMQAVEALLPIARSDPDLLEVLSRKVTASVTAGRKPLA